MKGIGVKKDLDEAFKWYKKSAELGCADAQMFVGNCYRTGYGDGRTNVVPKDSIEAINGCSWQPGMGIRKQKST